MVWRVPVSATVGEPLMETEQAWVEVVEATDMILLARWRVGLTAAVLEVVMVLFRRLYGGVEEVNLLVSMLHRGSGTMLAVIVGAGTVLEEYPDGPVAVLEEGMISKNLDELLRAVATGCWPRLSFVEGPGANCARYTPGSVCLASCGEYPAWRLAWGR